jgi:predicted O-methyltransferase YrrM
MRGSMLSKALRLARAHARHPRHVARYVANLRVPPIESGLPWFTFAAIDFLESWVKPHHSVFEFGCGGSTLFFAARAASVECVEHNAHWRATTMAALAKRRLGKVFIRQEPAGREPPLANSSYCRALDRPFDIVVVDGWALGKHTEADRRAVMSRAACFARAEEFAMPGSIIVLDDAWFDPSLTHRARERRSFPGVGPWRVGASSTDVFFY